MSVLNVLSDFFNPAQEQHAFVIYTNEAIASGASDSTAAIKFTSLYDLGYKNEVNVAYEPLEQGQFSSDSVQDTPYTLYLTGICAPVATSIDYTNNDMLNILNGVVTQLKTYLSSTTLLTILKLRPVFDQYTNLKMVSFSYDITPDHNILKAYIGFQEVRFVDTIQYGSLPQSQVNNPASASQIDNGNQAPKSPTSSIVNNSLGTQ